MIQTSLIGFLLILTTFACGENQEPLEEKDSGVTEEKDSGVTDTRPEPDADPLAARIDEVLEIEGDPSNGASLYRVSCSNCHDESGEAVEGKGVRVRDAVERIGERAVVRRIITGEGDYRTDDIFMPSFSAIANPNLADLLVHLSNGFDEVPADAGLEATAQDN